MAVLGETLQTNGVGSFPFREQLGGGCIECGELRVTEDGGLDVGCGDAELAVTSAGLLEQGIADARDDFPVAAEGVEIAVGYATAQVGGDVLEILGLGAVDVARKIEIVVVFRVVDLG